MSAFNGLALLLYRRGVGYSQEELADIIGCAPNSLSEWETGRKDPSLRSLVKICVATGMQPNQLVDKWWKE